MKVLMVTQDYPPKIYGGIGRHVGDLTSALRRNGSNVTVITTSWQNHHSSSDEPETIRVDRAGPMVPIYNGTHVWSPVDMLQFNISMASAGCCISDVDIVHCHDMFSVLAGYTIAARHDVPLVMTKHFILEALKDRVFPHLDRVLTDDEKQLYQYSVDLQSWSILHADRIIAVSDWTRQAVDLIVQGAGEKSVVIHNGTDIHKLLPPGHLRRDCWVSTPARPFTLVVAGRLKWKKGGDIAIRALATLDDLDCRLIFAGDGEYRPQLVTMVHDLGLQERVQFMGFLDSGSLAQVYLTADVVVVPSREEPFGLVASEALALGKLVVASNVGGLSEQIKHQVTGLLFEPDNHLDLANQIRWALANPAQIQQIVEHARAYAMTTLAWDAVAEQTVQQYKQAMSDHRPTKQSDAITSFQLQIRE
jgi:glycosyltransferase involved in cell wall biosynthesis